MDNKEELHQDIERFLSGEMDDNDRRKFEQMMEKNPELGEEVALHSDLAETFGDEDLSAFRAKVKRVTAKNRELEGSKTVKGSSFFLKIAAGLLMTFLVSALAYQFLIKNERSNSELVADYFQPYDNLISERGNTDETLSSAMFNYDRAQYEEAVRLFSELDPDSNPLINFYRGISYLGLNDAQNAILFLTRSEEQGNKSLEPAIKWYLSLSYLLEGNDTKGKELLRELSEGSSIYKKQAEDLLENMN